MVTWEQIYKKYDGRYDDLVTAYMDTLDIVIKQQKEIRNIKKSKKE